MIKKVREGDYELFETKSGLRIINLNSQGSFIWINAEGVGGVLVRSEKNHKPNKILTKGYFRVYDVVDEPGLTDLCHLEVCIGRGQWQGYLLPKGLPRRKSKHRIIPTKETISRGGCTC